MASIATILKTLPALNRSYKIFFASPGTFSDSDIKGFERKPTISRHNNTTL
jgi:hypothetical protein